ncbi:MAG: threonylcarbamoyl-AMP synthase [Candidatus Odinarchaeota archaeon]|nr:threonylcarbamoyl-AMP synthase [Candidatus Odinarchaeota archaeon]
MIVLKVPLHAKDKVLIRETVERGGVLAYPTDTVYGLGSNPYREDSVERIYRIKRRERSKPLPLLFDSMESIEKVAYVDDRIKRYLKRLWPGPVTFILKLKDRRLLNVTSGSPYVAVRIPKNEVALEVIKLSGGTLIGTSANRSGEPPCSDPNCVKRSIGEEIDILIDAGHQGVGIPSTIVRIGGDEVEILREGALKKEYIMEVLKSF